MQFNTTFSATHHIVNSRPFGCRFEWYIHVLSATDELLIMLMNVGNIISKVQLSYTLVCGVLLTMKHIVPPDT